MKTIYRNILALIAVVSLAGCLSEMDRRNKIINEIRTTEVYKVPDSPYYIARTKDDNVLLVHVHEGSGTVTTSLIFGTFVENVEKDESTSN